MRIILSRASTQKYDKTQAFRTNSCIVGLKMSCMKIAFLENYMTLSHFLATCELKFLAVLAFLVTQLLSKFKNSRLRCDFYFIFIQLSCLVNERHELLECSLLAETMVVVQVQFFLLLMFLFFKNDAKFLPSLILYHS